MGAPLKKKSGWGVSHLDQEARIKGSQTEPYPTAMKEAVVDLVKRGYPKKEIKEKMIKKYGRFPSDPTYKSWLRGKVEGHKEMIESSRKFGKTIDKLKELSSHDHLKAQMSTDTLLILEYLSDLIDTSHHESKMLSWKDKSQPVKAMMDAIQLKIGILKELSNQKLIEGFLVVVLEVIEKMVPERANEIKDALKLPVLEVVKDHLGIATFGMPITEVKAIESKRSN